MESYANPFQSLRIFEFLLKIYNNLAIKYPDAVLITSDFIKTQNDVLHSLSLVKNNETILNLKYISNQNLKQKMEFKNSKYGQFIVFQLY